MNSGSSSLELLRNILTGEGLEHMVIAPGSRNAPLINAFCGLNTIKTTVIFDERSAGFFALGIAQRLRRPVAVACTSGTAVLNLAPSIAEAYYQKIPLLILTADRPREWIDQGDGQTIRQYGIFDNYIKKSFELPQFMHTKDETWHCTRMITEAFRIMYGDDPGPVHINLPFAEPLYQPLSRLPVPVEISKVAGVRQTICTRDLAGLKLSWIATQKIMILAGMMEPCQRLNELLEELASFGAIVVFTETTSNLSGDSFLANIDRVLSTLTAREKMELAPELLITIGGPVISKRVKSWLREFRPAEHWHIHPADTLIDTYQNLSRSIPVQPEIFFESLPGSLTRESDYSEKWTVKSNYAARIHDEYLAGCEYSDFLVFSRILEKIPEGSDIQLGNSSPVRYAQLFGYSKQYLFHSNRGTSGIDGTLSTAAGAAFADSRPTTIITGDLAFFYDSNFLLIPSLPANLRVIMINNGGGGIFRIIDGPSSTIHLETVFEARHQWNAELLVKNFGIPYFRAESALELDDMLLDFYRDHDGKPAILEIITPTEKNAVVLKDYFSKLSGSGQ